ncbi:MAG: endo-1,4-beta-xylanase [Candidatus Heimdallarchaeota archaeon]
MNRKMKFIAAQIIFGLFYSALVSFGAIFYIPASYDITLEQDLHTASPFPIGAAINPVTLKTDSQYRNLVLKHFNSITAENAMKMRQLRPVNDSYFYWEDADFLVDFAVNNSIQIHGHTLVWHLSVPDWLASFEGDRDAWRDLLKNHIQTVVGRYKGKIASWDVVNEAIFGEGYRKTIWYEKIGPDYIKDSFIWAHEADPDAKLYYNEYHLCRKPEKLLLAIDKITEMLSEGVPIHGLGYQAHMTDASPSVSELREFVKLVNELPIDIRISEMDFLVNERNLFPIFSSILANKQKKRIDVIIPELLEITNLTGITFWGVFDGQSWKNTSIHPDWPLLFDTHYKPKPAALGFLESLQKL